MVSLTNKVEIGNSRLLSSVTSADARTRVRSLFRESCASRSIQGHSLRRV
jgi:hypothetical protein